jgi:hypothetical protein
MVSTAVAGARLRDLPQHERARVRDWFADHLGTAGPGTPRPAPDATEPRYPPRREVEALWRACERVVGDAEVSGYLTGRGLDPSTLADLDLCRALPRDADLPSWARGPGGMWTTTGHRLVCPLYDARGQLRSVIARRVRDGDDPKSLAPSGHERRGLVMADGLARQVLGLAARPVWWDPDVPLSAVICEGEIDHLVWCTRSEAAADSGHGPAVAGVVQGSWTGEIAARLELAGVHDVVIATDLDDPGEKLATRIAWTWTVEGVEVRRWKP